MTEQNDNSGEILLKISASVGEKQKLEEPVVPNKLKPEYTLLERMNIETARVKRNSEHGLTDVQTFKFVAPNQRQKVLQLFDNPVFYTKLPNLFEFIFELGQDDNAEKRFYAALAVSELSATQPFVDLKDRIIRPWATGDSYICRQSAARALSFIVKKEQCEKDVLILLKHWTGINNLALNETGLLTYYWIAQSYPYETLDSIKNLLNEENLLQSLQIIDVIARVYDLYPKLVIDYLHKWLVKNTKPYLRWMAGLMFILMVRLDDISKGQKVIETRQKIVEIIFTLWDDHKIPMRLEIQEDTTKKVESWAKEALADRENNELDSFESYRLLFNELYQKYENHRTNRLDFYLRRWQKQKDWEQRRATKRGDTDSLKEIQGDFIDLIPQSQIKR